MRQFIVLEKEHYKYELYSMALFRSIKAKLIFEAQARGVIYKSDNRVRLNDTLYRIVPT
jgi:hypothetical protein